MKKMKTLIIVLTAILLSCSNSFAQNIAVINTDILKDSEVVKFISKKISDKEKSYKVDLEKKYAALERDYKKIEAKKAVLSESAMKEEEDKFTSRVEALKLELTTKQETLKTASLDALKQVDIKVNEIIEKIRADKGINLVVPSSSVVSYDNNLDISAEVLKNLNKSLKTVKISFN